MDVVDLLTERIDAEMAFAIRLDKMGSEKFFRSFTVGLLSDTVVNYKLSCQAKAKQAAELCDNTHQNCIEPLRQLVAS